MLGPGLLFVVSGPSGAGKDTLVERLLRRVPRMRYSVSATTREPRPGEVEGEHYFFWPLAEFETKRDRAEFLEWREYHGNLYGTPKRFVERTLSDGYDLVMKPEVNGALAIKREFPQAILVFLLPDKFSYLQQRLAARRTESPDEIAARLAIAHEELTFIRSFDYLVINEEASLDGPHDLPAVDDLEAILRAERLRIHHYDDNSIRDLEQS
ncbi:MAG: guanylate kinase [Candidatus Baltobacteraceae bacterium]